ncbi:MAG TPA: motility protein A [Spirochaetota bacterium]|nr:motility protein A [Spirochaetota bacterium]HQQ22374.1 motility protein A [Spirochaetota bacterium]
MDLASIIGLAAGTVCIILGILMAKGNLLLFWDPASVFVTLGGSLSALVLSVPLSKFLGLTKALRIVFFAPKSNANEMIITLVSFSEKARREGLLALEDDLDELEDDFLKKGIQLVVDGSDPEMVRRIMETEIEQMMDRHDVFKTMISDLSGLAPGFGMLGTLMGLILMLVNIQDKNAIGPGMAAALITTFYGAIIANLLCLPIAAKMQLRTNEEVLIKMIMIEGTLSIQSGDNPRLVKDKLVAYLEPNEREAISNEVGE